jgi:hypothetical protein
MTDKNLDKEIAKYQVAIDKNISESEILWNRYSTILIFNSILITAIGLSYQDNIVLPGQIKIFLPIAGLLTCFIWWFITWRGFYWIDHWIDCAREIEDKYLKKSSDNEKNQSWNPVLYGYEKSKNRKIVNTNNAAYLLILLMAVTYALFLIFPSSSYSRIKNKKTLYFHHNHRVRRLFLK